MAVLGLPGSGKTTLARGLRDALGYQVLSVGEALRERARDDATLESDLARGALAPEPLIRTVINEAVQASGDHRLIVDGFPRHVGQISPADDILGEWHPLLVEVPPEVAFQRLAGRQGLAPIGRAEDTPEVAQRRLVDAGEQLAKLLDALRLRGQFIFRVSGNDDTVKVLSNARNLLDSR